MINLKQGAVLDSFPNKIAPDGRVGITEKNSGLVILSRRDPDKEGMTLEASYDPRTGEKQYELHSSHTYSVQQVFEIGITYVAARWLTQGCPKRDEISCSFALKSREEQEDGIKLRRLDLGALQKRH
jgi:hypothetical protein